MSNLQEKVQSILDDLVSKETECGCQAALFIDGELVCNAYAGYTDWTKSKKVDENTVFPVYSTGKAIASTVIHRLVERGVLSYDMKVTDVWPEYGCNGKEETHLWHLLAYRMGMVDEPSYNTWEENADWNLMCSKLASMTPIYPPGTKQQYHPRTYGWLVGEVACRATGKDFATLFREEVGNVADMNRFFYGISPEETNKVTLVAAKNGDTYNQGVVDYMNNPIFQQCCNPSVCTMTNALSVAKHYNALDQGTLLSSKTIEEATKLKRADDDAPVFTKDRWGLFGLGYVLSGPINDLGRIFGHGGVGGSEGLLDKGRHMAIGFTRNLFAEPNGLHDFYKAIGFSHREW